MTPGGDFPGVAIPHGSDLFGVEIALEYEER